MCAHAVRVALEKIEGVTDVTVSLNEGQATLAFGSGNTVSVSRVWGAIRRNGFTPREARVQVRGHVVHGDGQLALRVAGSEPAFVLAVPPTLQPRLDSLPDGAVVVIDGSLAAPERDASAAPHPLRVIQFAVEDPAR